MNSACISVCDITSVNLFRLMYVNYIYKGIFEFKMKYIAFCDLSTGTLEKMPYEKHKLGK